MIRMRNQNSPRNESEILLFIILFWYSYYNISLFLRKEIMKIIVSRWNNSALLWKNSKKDSTCISTILPLIRPTSFIHSNYKHYHQLTAISTTIIDHCLYHALVSKERAIYIYIYMHTVYIWLIDWQQNWVANLRKRK